MSPDRVRASTSTSRTPFTAAPRQTSPAARSTPRSSTGRVDSWEARAVRRGPAPSASTPAATSSPGPSTRRGATTLPWTPTGTTPPTACGTALSRRVPLGPRSGDSSGPAGRGGAGQPTHRPIVSLRVSPRQLGALVRVRLEVGRALRGLTLRLVAARRGVRVLAVRRVGAVGPGRRTVTLRLDAGARSSLARRGRLTASLRAVAMPVTGATQTVRRSVRLVRR